MQRAVLELRQGVPVDGGEAVLHGDEPPAEHLIRWRIGLAQSGLRRGRSIKQLADDLGYASAAALSRVFAQKVGVSPRDWLKNQPRA